MITVEHTKPHPTDKATIGGVEGWVQVAEAKLVLLECKAHESLLWENNGVIRLSPHYTRDIKNKYLKPILISETEKTEEGEWCLNPDGHLDVFGYDYRAWYTEEQIAGVKKVLALPQHFPSGTLDVIIEGRLTNGSKCLVECQEILGSVNEGYSTFATGDFVVKLNPYITIYPVEETMIPLSRVKEMAVEFAREWQMGNILTQKGVDKWFKENVG